MTLEEIAREFSLSGLPWRDGMRNQNGDRFNYMAGEVFTDHNGFDHVAEGHDRLDLSDSLTRRGILDAIREVPGWENAYVFKIEGGRWVFRKDYYMSCMGVTEPEVLIAAWREVLKAGEAR